MSFGSTQLVFTPQTPVQLGALLHRSSSAWPGTDCKKQVPDGPSCAHEQPTASTTVGTFFFLAYVWLSDPFTICQAELNRMTFLRILTPCIAFGGAWWVVFLAGVFWATARLNTARSNSKAMSNLFMGPPLVVEED
ncbi:MAG TPA: hypothetical protein VGN90_14850 [Pyrinomonadaceae bacterium]|jgi:hypothetical protein|nr:hypothetical protein [Pyrinomonadaceae bacterium]